MLNKTLTVALLLLFSAGLLGAKESATALFRDVSLKNDNCNILFSISSLPLKTGINTYLIIIHHTPMG